MNGDILTKLVTFNHYQVQTTTTTLRRSLVVRSRSSSEG